MLKRLFLMALATMSISMTTGCGRTAMPMAADLGTVRTASHQAVVYAAGKPRKLGFDLNRYMLKQAPVAHPQTLPPVQGLTPSKVDLRGQCSPVYDQEDIGACTAFAVAKGMREYLQVAHHERQVPLSALYQYYETRKIRGSVDQDSGATITDAIKAATPGIAPDATWGYDTLQFDKQPPAAAYKAAGEFKLAKTVQLAGLEDIKKALGKGQPVVFGMKLYNYMQNIGPSGAMKMPEDGDIYVGGHAVCVVGYDNKKKMLIVRNSWGTAWGDKGYFYMPYAYVTPENVMDIWTAQ